MSRTTDEEERLFEGGCWRIVLDEVAPVVAHDAVTKARAPALRSDGKLHAARARKF